MSPLPLYNYHFYNSVVFSLLRLSLPLCQSPLSLSLSLSLPSSASLLSLHPCLTFKGSFPSHVCQSPSRSSLSPFPRLVFPATSSTRLTLTSSLSCDTSIQISRTGIHSRQGPLCVRKPKRPHHAQEGASPRQTKTRRVHPDWRHLASIGGHDCMGPARRRTRTRQKCTQLGTGYRRKVFSYLAGGRRWCVPFLGE